MNSTAVRALVISALLAGLAYVSNFMMLVIPNVSLAFFVVFLAGYSLGLGWGLITGSISFFLISYFSPFGMALFPLLGVQIICGAICGAFGSIAYKAYRVRLKDPITYLIYALWGGVVTTIYMGGVSVADAYLFGPFKERLTISLGFSILTIVSNLIIFPLLVPVLMTVRERIDVR
ncbi:MAG: ECF transporter S component [candidate division Zixibacteria bacterium]|nr:ECF transporter S component [candidate division Zixibacteria bacterium]